MEKKHEIMIIAISGGSGSGKTTAAKKLQKILGNENCKIISQDSYYIDHSKIFNGDGSVNFDHPNAIDFKLMSQHLKKLSEFEEIEIPIYDFVTHTRKKDTIIFKPSKFIIVDGTLILSQDELRPFFNISIFLDIPEETRYSRRLNRDVKERGRQPEGVKLQFNSFVKPMHETFVQPSRKFATYIAYDEISLELIFDKMRQSILF